MPCSRIKVAFVSWHLIEGKEPTDGVATYNANIIFKLKEMGVKVYEIWRREGLTGLWPIYNVLSFYKVSKYIKQNKINIVHGSNADGFLLSFYEGLPYVHTVHAVIAGELEAAGELMRALTERKFLRFIIYKSLVEAEMTAVSNADAIIVPSDYLKNEVVKYYGISPRKIIVIPHGVNIGEFEKCTNVTQRKSWEADARVKILFVGKLVPRKGLIYLIKACEYLYDKHHKIELRIVGDGPEKMGLEYYCKKKKLDFVKFLGSLSRKKVVEEFNNCDIFCLSSLHESFGIVLLEAMAAKKPVVATCVGGIPEVVHDGITGILVPPRDEESLATALEKLVADKELRFSMGMKGFERALFYTWEKSAKKIGANLLFAL